MKRRTLLRTVSASLVGAAGVGSAAAKAPRSGRAEKALSTARTGTVVHVSDGDTVTVQFDDGTEEQVRLQGVDSPEMPASRQHERPEEWEGLAYRDDRQLLQLRFDSACSLHAPGGTKLTDDAVVAVNSEPTARTDDTDDEEPPVTYNGPVPLVGVSGRVVGFGAIMVDGPGNFEQDNEEYLLNVWDEYVGSGTVLWDESHDQYFDTEQVSEFVKYAEENGYAVNGTSALADDLSDADATVITSPSKPFTPAELDALTSFVEDGGAVFLHSQSDYDDLDETGNHNEILEALGTDFRFSDDQVFDEVNNDGPAFQPLTRNFTDSFSHFLTDRPGIDGLPARSSETLFSTAIDAKSFAKDRLLEQTVTVRFDGGEPSRDSYDRLLGYVYYDADGSSRLFNLELVEEGLARVFGAGFSRHREFWLAEADARSNGRGVWADSDIESAPSYRNRQVESLFFPAPASVRTTDGELARDRAPVRAMSSATQDRSPGVTYDVSIPLVGVDPEARVAAVGAPIIDHQYEAFEGYGVDTSSSENFTFLTNLIVALSKKGGDVLIDGGHGQFAADHAVASEGAVYYQRYLEGQGFGLEQRNTITEDTLSDGRALLISSPPSSFTEAEREAVSSFVDDGGAVVLLGSGGVPPDRTGNLNDLAAAIGSDLRFNVDAVVDSNHQLTSDPAVFETHSFAVPYGGVFDAFDGSAALPQRAARGNPEVSDGQTPPAPTTVASSDAGASGPLSGLLLPAGIAAGGVTATALAILGMRRRGDPEDEGQTEMRADGGAVGDDGGEPR